MKWRAHEIRRTGDKIDNLNENNTLCLHFIIKYFHVCLFLGGEIECLLDRFSNIIPQSTKNIWVPSNALSLSTNIVNRFLRTHFVMNYLFYLRNSLGQSSTNNCVSLGEISCYVRRYLAKLILYELILEHVHNSLCCFWLFFYMHHFYYHLLNWGLRNEQMNNKDKGEKFFKKSLLD